MKMIQVVPAISEQSSGPSYSVVRLCQALIEKQQDVELAALNWTAMPSPPRFLRAFPLGFGPRRLGRSPAMWEWLSTQASSGSIDLIHNHSLWMMPNVYSGQVANRYSIPLVVSPRGTLSEWAMQSGSSTKSVFWPLIQRPALAATTCFHATALSEYEDIRRAGFRQPVAIIPNGIDIPAISSKSGDNLRTLLFLGRIHPVKGLDLLLTAWRAVQDKFPKWRLRIVGPDNDGYLAQMRHLAGELGLKRIVFSGPLHGEQKFEAFSQADLFVLPTRSENFGIAVAEALAAGVPAIVSKGAPWSALKQKAAGWWIDIGVDPLVASLEDALSRPPESLIEMGQRGRSWMQAEYSWGQLGQQMLETYRWILRGSDRPAWVIQN